MTEEQIAFIDKKNLDYSNIFVINQKVDRIYNDFVRSFKNCEVQNLKACITKRIVSTFRNPETIALGKYKF